MASWISEGKVQLGVQGQGAARLNGNPVQWPGNQPSSYSPMNTHVPGERAMGGGVTGGEGLGNEPS